MRPDNVELAGGNTLEALQASRRSVLERAPAWWRAAAEAEFRRANAGGPATTAKPKPKPASSASKRAADRPLEYAGWLAGTCCPGVSQVSYSPNDRQRLPEQFTGRAILQMYRRACELSRPIPLQWKHQGITLATTADLSLLFRHSGTFGLEFEAWLRPSKWSDCVLRMSEQRGFGVSIGYRMEKCWYVERGGQRIRIVDAAELVHVAVIPESDGMEACFSGARAYGKRGHSFGCPFEIRDKARTAAFRVMLHQAENVG